MRNCAEGLALSAKPPANIQNLSNAGAGLGAGASNNCASLHASRDPDSKEHDAGENQGNPEGNPG